MIDLIKLKHSIQRGDTIPFSINIDGKKAKFQKIGITREAKNGLCGRVAYELVSDNLRVMLELEYHPEFPVLTWRTRLFAVKDTPKISDVCLMDMDVTNNAACLLRGISGGFRPYAKEGESNFPPKGLLPWEEKITDGSRFELNCGGCGKSSAQQIPIWFYHDDTAGIWFGPEWSGTWELNVSRQGDTASIKVRMPDLDFRMLQGEEIELPAFSISVYEGDRDFGQNHLRRTIRDHFMAHDENDKPILPPVMHQGLCGQENYYNEDGIKAEMARAAELGCEYYTFNAHWFFGPVQTGKHANTKQMPWGERPVECWFNMMGDYILSSEKFPSGADALRDYVESLGMQLGYWIDPRVGDESEALNNNPEIAICPDPAVADGNPFMSPWLVDLSRRAGRQWLEDTLERIINEYHGKWIWLDNNAYPRHQYWNYHETPDRRGLMELFYYQGFYEVFDRVMERHPDVCVESCANGGMIIDLGTIRRSHAIWVNDWVGFEAAGQDYDIDVNRNHRSGASHWLPGALVENSLYCPWEVTQSDELYPDTKYVSHFAGTFAFGQRVLRWKQADIDRGAELIKIFKEFRPYLLADYYELFPVPQSRDQWDGWQFHNPDDGTGWVILFRLSADSTETQKIGLHYLPEPENVKWEVKLAPADYEYVGKMLTVSLEPEACAILQYQSQ